MVCRAAAGPPAAQVLADWREANGITRARLAALGRDATLITGAGPCPNGLQAFRYPSECATHADDVGAPVTLDEQPGRTAWRVRFGRFALAERGSAAQVHQTAGTVAVRPGSLSAQLSAAGFVEATVGRLLSSHPLDHRLRDALRCLA